MQFGLRRWLAKSLHIRYTTITGPELHELPAGPTPHGRTRRKTALLPLESDPWCKSRQPSQSFREMGHNRGKERYVRRSAGSESIPGGKVSAVSEAS